MTLSLDRIRELRAQAELRKLRANEVSLMLDHGIAAGELLSMLAAAETLARLEAWLAENRTELVCWKRVAAGGFTAMFARREEGDDGYGLELLTALTRALDKADGLR